MNPAGPGLPGQPQDAEGPVFREPWEAQAFATALMLHQRGLYSWSEWAKALAQQIAAAEARGEPDRGEAYYRHWLGALEATLAVKGLSTKDELQRYQHAWAHAAERTPHGQPIELLDRDFAP